MYAILTEIMYNDREKQGTMSVIYLVQKCKVKLLNPSTLLTIQGCPPSFIIEKIFQILMVIMMMRKKVC